MHCKNCGSLLPENVACCPFCGKPIALPKGVAPAPQPSAPQSPAPQPSAPRYHAVVPDSDTALTTLQYFIMLILFAIPVVGLVLMLYWAFADHVSPARRNLARAFLIRTAILFVIGALLAALLVGAVSSYFRSHESYRPYYDDYYDRYYDDYDDYFDDFFDDFDDYFDDHFGPQGNPVGFATA